MGAVADITADIGQIHEYRVADVFTGLLHSLRTIRIDSMKLKISIILIVTLLLLAASGWAADAPHLQIRKKAHKAYTDGNWKDALIQYQILTLKTGNDPKLVGKDFIQAWQCLRNLNRLSETQRR